MYDAIDSQERDFFAFGILTFKEKYATLLIKVFALSGRSRQILPKSVILAVV